MSWFRELLGRIRSMPSTSQLKTFPAEPLSDSDSKISTEQSARKQRSEALLRSARVPINDWLPTIEGEAEITLRTPAEIAQRLAALVVVAFKASERPKQSVVESIVVERGYRPFFTPEELVFIDSPDPLERARIKFSWRCEAAWPLLWALQYVDGSLGLPRETCDVPFLSETVYRAFDLAAPGIRSASEILDEADLIYRCHWAVRQAGLDGAPAPAGLDPGVTMERHHALNWLIGYNDNADWDDVTTDT
jgi:hypothetical protein